MQVLPGLLTWKVVSFSIKGHMKDFALMAEDTFLRNFFFFDKTVKIRQFVIRQCTILDIFDHSFTIVSYILQLNVLQ